VKAKLRALSNTNPFLLIIVFVFALDQSAKLLALRFVNVYCNEKGVFGLDLPAGGNLALALISFAILSYLIYLISHENSRQIKWPMALIIGGGLSNMFDRLIFGCVRDFISLYYRLPSFNVADIFISFGVILFLISFFIKTKK